MYMLASHVIAVLAGMSYPEFTKARIFEPLNMTRTTFSAQEASKDGLLSHAWTKFGRRIPFWSTDDIIAVMAGPGGVISNVEDLVGISSLRELAVQLKMVFRRSGSRCY